jgi:hypothetical protein
MFSYLNPLAFVLGKKSTMAGKSNYEITIYNQYKQTLYCLIWLMLRWTTFTNGPSWTSDLLNMNFTKFTGRLKVYMFNECTLKLLFNLLMHFYANYSVIINVLYLHKGVNIFDYTFTKN